LPWTTYAEAGARLGVSAEAVRAIAKRRHWPRRRSNTDPHGAVEVEMPDDVQISPKPPARPVTLRSPPDHSDLAAGALAALETAVMSLTARAEAAEQGRELERARAEDLRVQIAVLNAEIQVMGADSERALSAMQAERDGARREAQEAAQALDAARVAEAERKARGLLARLKAAWRGR
jgi:MinD-like ATPase involved in chromosome partitioning or flagellar assembly